MDEQMEIDRLHDLITDCYIEVQALRVPVDEMERKRAATTKVLAIREGIEALGLRRSEHGGR